jgi:hypothetical protein
MTDCTNGQMVFPYYKHKPLTVNFKGGDISSDGGMLLVRQLDERLRIVDRVVSALTDRRDQRYIDHDLMTLLRQRIYQMVAGYEDCNDATTLRKDPVPSSAATRPRTRVTPCPVNRRSHAWRTASGSVISLTLQKLCWSCI